MIGKKFMMWVGAGILSAAMIPAVSEARNLAAHKAASSPTPLVATSPLHKTVKTTAIARKATRLHTSHKLTKLSGKHISHVKLHSKVKHTALHGKHIAATKLHSKVKTAAPVM